MNPCHIFLEDMMCAHVVALEKSAGMVRGSGIFSFPKFIHHVRKSTIEFTCFFIFVIIQSEIGDVWLLLLIQAKVVRIDNRLSYFSISYITDDKAASSSFSKECSTRTAVQFHVTRSTELEHWTYLPLNTALFRPCYQQPYRNSEQSGRRSKFSKKRRVNLLFSCLRQVNGVNHRSTSSGRVALNIANLFLITKNICHYNKCICYQFRSILFLHMAQRKNIGQI